MGLTLVNEDNLLCPMFVCDYCRKPIRAVRDWSRGIVLWNPQYIGDEEIIGPIYYVHQGRCDQMFSRAHRHFWSRELSAFLAQLSHNTTTIEATR